MKLKEKGRQLLLKSFKVSGIINKKASQGQKIQ